MVTRRSKTIWIDKKGKLLIRIGMLRRISMPNRNVKKTSKESLMNLERWLISLKLENPTSSGILVN